MIKIVWNVGCATDWMKMKLIIKEFYKDSTYWRQITHSSYDPIHDATHYELTCGHRLFFYSYENVDPTIIDDCMKCVFCQNNARILQRKLTK